MRDHERRSRRFYPLHYICTLLGTRPCQGEAARRGIHAEVRVSIRVVLGAVSPQHLHDFRVSSTLTSIGSPWR